MPARNSRTNPNRAHPNEPFSRNSGRAAHPGYQYAANQAPGTSSSSAALAASSPGQSSSAAALWGGGSGPRIPNYARPTVSSSKPGPPIVRDRRGGGGGGGRGGRASHSQSWSPQRRSRARSRAPSRSHSRSPGQARLRADDDGAGARRRESKSPKREGLGTSGGNSGGCGLDGKPEPRQWSETEQQQLERGRVGRPGGARARGPMPEAHALSRSPSPARSGLRAASPAPAESSVGDSARVLESRGTPSRVKSIGRSLSPVPGAGGVGINPQQITPRSGSPSKGLVVSPFTSPGRRFSVPRRISLGSEGAQIDKPVDKPRVYIRLRPLEAEEENNCWQYGKREVHMDEHAFARKNCMGDDAGLTIQQSVQFTFDQVYGPEVDNKGVYADVVEPMLGAFLEGYNAAVFSYGQTGSGKTHTMFGSAADSRGVIFHALDKICSRCEGHAERRFLLRMEVVEIYNEEVYDLLQPDKPKLLIVDHPHKGNVCSGSNELIFTSAREGVDIVQRGLVGRAVRATAMNPNSSRSHAVVRVNVESRECHPGEPGGIIGMAEVSDWMQDSRRASLTVSAFNFVDLTGSERVKKAGTDRNKGMLKEGTMINKSLVTLGICIRELGKPEGGGFVPYRDSKLTRLLRSALGGNSRSAAICTVNVADAHAEETRSTLHFADGAARVVNSATKNVRGSSDQLLDQYLSEIDNLRAQLERQSRDQSPIPPARVSSPRPPTDGQAWQRSVHDAMFLKLQESNEFLTEELHRSQAAIQSLSQQVQTEKMLTHYDHNELRRLRSLEDTWEARLRAKEQQHTDQISRIQSTTEERLRKLQKTVKYSRLWERGRFQTVISRQQKHIEALEAARESVDLSFGASTPPHSSEEASTPSSHAPSRHSVSRSSADAPSKWAAGSSKGSPTRKKSSPEPAPPDADSLENMLAKFNTLKRTLSTQRQQGILHLSDEERQKLLASIKELEDAHRRNLSKSSLLNWQKWRAAEKKLLDQEHQKQEEITRLEVEYQGVIDQLHAELEAVHYKMDDVFLTTLSLPTNGTNVALPTINEDGESTRTSDKGCHATGAVSSDANVADYSIATSSGVTSSHGESSSGTRRALRNMSLLAGNERAKGASDSDSDSQKGQKRAVMSTLMTPLRACFSSDTSDASPRGGDGQHKERESLKFRTIENIAYMLDRGSSNGRKSQFSHSPDLSRERRADAAGVPEREVSGERHVSAAELSSHLL